MELTNIIAGSLHTVFGLFTGCLNLSIKPLDKLLEVLVLEFERVYRLIGFVELMIPIIHLFDEQGPFLFQFQNTLIQFFVDSDVFLYRFVDLLVDILTDLTLIR